MRVGRRPEPSTDLSAVREALAGVQDPELHLSLAEAGMLEDVTADCRGNVRVTLRLTTPTCPLRNQLETGVRTALTSLPGVGNVQVRFTSMSDPERLRLAQRLRTPRASLTGFSSGSGTRVYAIASGKGGVGKSTVTANLACALADQGLRVGVLDADVWGWSIPQLFGVDRAPVALKVIMFPVAALGLALMSIGFLVDADTPVVWRGPMLHKALEQLLDDVHWGPLDVLLIDLPPGTGDVALSLLELVPEAQLILVTTPQVAAQTVALRAGRMAQDVRAPIAGVIENMTHHAQGPGPTQQPLFGEGGGTRLATALNVPLLGRIPLDPQLRIAGDRGLPVVLSDPAADPSREIRRIADSLPNTRRSIAGRYLPLEVVTA